MKKSEARDKAVDYLWNAGCAFSDIACKISIDDSGGLSEEGYNDDDLEQIQEQVYFLLKKILPFKKPTK